MISQRHNASKATPNYTNGHVNLSGNTKEVSVETKKRARSRSSMDISGNLFVILTWTLVLASFVFYVYLRSTREARLKSLLDGGGFAMNSGDEKINVKNRKEMNKFNHGSSFNFNLSNANKKHLLHHEKLHNDHDQQEGTGQQNKSYFVPAYPPLPDGTVDPNWVRLEGNVRAPRNPDDFKVHFTPEMEWERKLKKMEATGNLPGPKVDYTKIEYKYPEMVYGVPDASIYPPLTKLGDLMERWPQDDLDNPPIPFKEDLLHFDFQNEEQMKVAEKFRDQHLPFKVYNVPELIECGEKWTDEYLSTEFDQNRKQPRVKGKKRGGAGAQGHTQQSANNFFCFFTPNHWHVDLMGKPPTLDNDFSFKRFAAHARYADAVGISHDATHYYFQAGVDRSDRNLPVEERSFISVDLPSFGSPEHSFFMWSKQNNKGIQCRFGERGVTAATHYDSGKNMVAMITGAKRYILAPPVACSKLAIETSQHHSIFRHSVLNFGHINLLENDPETKLTDMERKWLDLAKDSPAVETILKAGEVLFIPSHWFHYITSVQKSAQCNTRSGVEMTGHEVFGNLDTVVNCREENFSFINANNI